MKIGIYCTNNLTYPLPKGAIYANMHLAGQMADALASRGHEVVFFAPLGTQTKANLVTFDMLPFSDERVYNHYPHEGSSYQYENIMMMKALNYLQEHGFDVFHSHSRPFSIINFAPLKQVPTIATVHDPLVDSAYNVLHLYNDFSNLHLTSLTYAQRQPQPKVDWATNIYNGVDTQFWQFNQQDKGYLLFAGRIMEEKGVDIAVQTAIKTGLPLKIAGSIYPHSQHYFDQQIKPYLNNKIEYLGSLPQEQLVELYQGALALLMPIRWQEPFGLVMTEAMSCGTPVIAPNLASVSEIVVHQKTGIITPTADVENFVEAVNNINQIDRRECREHTEEKFSFKVMVDHYEEQYQKVSTIEKPGS